MTSQLTDPFFGGLLARSGKFSSGNFTNHNYYHADGNGNITYLETAGQGLAASYRYDPFGNLLTSSGSLATTNSYRFSSKEYMSAVSLYYYLYRFYSPAWQRWLNRDPIEESGGINLYDYAENDPMSEVDAFGLELDPTVEQGIVDEAKQGDCGNSKSMYQEFKGEMSLSQKVRAQEAIAECERNKGKTPPTHEPPHHDPPVTTPICSTSPPSSPPSPPLRSPPIDPSEPPNDPWPTPTNPHHRQSPIQHQSYPWPIHPR